MSPKHLTSERGHLGTGHGAQLTILEPTASTVLALHPCPRQLQARAPHLALGFLEPRKGRSAAPEAGPASHSDPLSYLTPAGLGRCWLSCCA